MPEVAVDPAVETAGNPARGARSPAWLLSFLLLLACGPAHAGAAPAPRVVLVLQHGVDAEALLGPKGPLPALPGAAVALMNTAVAGPPRVESAYLTVGTGARLGVGEGEPPALYHPDEATGEGRAADVYARRVGPLPPEAWLLLPGLPSLGGPPPDGAVAGTPRPGALAEAVARSGRRVALLVFGPRSPRERWGGLVAMDARGVVARGRFLSPDTGASFDQERPAGARSRGKAGWRMSVTAAGTLGLPPERFMGADLAILDLGGATGSPAMPDLLPDLARWLDPARDTLLAVVPAPRPRGDAWDRLTPVLAWGRGVRGGRLVSRTTRTPGLVANIDVAPTIAAWLGVPDARFAGHAMRVRPWVRGEGPADLLALSRRVTVNRAALYPVLGGAGLAAVLTLLLLLGALRWPTPRRARGARALLLAIAALPLSLLFVPAAAPRDVAAYSAQVAAGALLIALAVAGSARRRSAVRPLIALYVLTTGVLVLDLLLGGQAIAASLLSDFPLAGFRFYGIGNEYAGLLVGMAAVGLPAALDRAPGARWALPIGFLALAALIGAPWWGANFGAALAAAAAFAVMLRLLAPGQLRPARLLLGMAALLLLVAVGLFALDALRPPEERTHVGQLVERLLAGGEKGGALLLVEVASRKWSMNLRLIRTPIALAILIGVVPLLLLGYHGAKARLAAHLAARRALWAGVVGALAGGGVGFLVNDSGIVLWGLATGAALAALLDSLLEEASGVRSPCG